MSGDATVRSVLRHLDRVIPAEAGRPEGANADHPMRKVTWQVAFEPSGWTPERRAKVAELFDGMAPEWHTRASSERTDPVIDALDRGGPWVDGLCVEVGSGVGLLSSLLAARFGSVIALDLSFEMLRRAPTEPPRVQGDGSQLPLAGGTAAVVVAVNAFLFPAELDRVLMPGGAVVWVNTLGDSTPIHLSADQVVEALPGAWGGVASEAGWGTWAVLRRRERARA